MNQIPLNIINQLPYKRGNLVLHTGITELYSLCLQAAESQKFQILFIEGAARSGKTHISVALIHDLSEQGFYPRLINGRELLEKLNSGQLSNAWQTTDVLIVDDVDHCLQEIDPGSSGRFVDLVESMRTANSKLLLFSSSSRSILPCDEHVMSRLNQGAGFTIANPEREEVAQIIDGLAKQRGMQLSPAKCEYIARRVSREIAKIEERLDNVSYLSQLLGEKVKFPLLAKSI